MLNRRDLLKNSAFLAAIGALGLFIAVPATAQFRNAEAAVERNGVHEIIADFSTGD